MSHLKKKNCRWQVNIKVGREQWEKELINKVHGNLQWWAVVRMVKNVRTPQIRLLDHLNDCLL